MSINDELTARATKLRVAVADVAARSSRHGTAPSDRPVSYLPPLQAAPSRRSTAGPCNGANPPSRGRSGHPGNVN